MSSRRCLVDAIWLEMVLSKLNELPRKDVDYIFILANEAISETEETEGQMEEPHYEDFAGAVDV